MKKQIPATINLSLGALFFCANLFCFLWLPVLLHHNPWWWLAWLPVILTTNTLWALIHEAIHCIFHSNKKVNLYCGRLLSLSFGTEFHVTRFGHLLHHRFNRTGLDLTDGYDPKKTSRWQANIPYFLQICIGLYLSEILVPILFLLPQRFILTLGRKALGEDSPHYQIAQSTLLKQPTLTEIRLDTIVMLALWVVSFYLYGHFWWILLIAAGIRGFMVSFADNLPHYGTRIDDVRYAYNLSMPYLLQKWILNFNLHRVHHHFPNVPWQQLPAKFAEQQEKLDVNYFKQGMRQWRGVIPVQTLSLKKS